MNKYTFAALLLAFSLLGGAVHAADGLPEGLAIVDGRVVGQADWGDRGTLHFDCPVPAEPTEAQCMQLTVAWRRYAKKDFERAFEAVNQPVKTKALMVKNGKDNVYATYTNPAESRMRDWGPDAAQSGLLEEEEARYAAALATDFLAALGIGTEDVALHTHRNAPAYEGSFWISDEMRAANEQRYAERAKKHLENHGYPIDGYTLVAAPFVLRGLRLATVISWDAGYADDPGAHIATDIGASFDILDGGDILGFAIHNVPLVTSETPYALVSWQEALQIALDRKQEVYYGLQPDQIDVSQKDPYGGTLEPYLNVVTRIALEYVSDVQWTFRPVWRFYQEARPVE